MMSKICFSSVLNCRVSAFMGILDVVHWPCIQRPSVLGEESRSLQKGAYGQSLTIAFAQARQLSSSLAQHRLPSRPGASYVSPSLAMCPAGECVAYGTAV